MRGLGLPRKSVAPAWLHSLGAPRRRLVFRAPQARRPRYPLAHMLLMPRHFPRRLDYDIWRTSRGEICAFLHATFSSRS